jgi:hypothetical protein
MVESVRYLVGVLGRGISPSQGLYLYRKALNRKTRTYVHVFSGIQIHELSVQAIKAFASHLMATGNSQQIFVLGINGH